MPEPALRALFFRSTYTPEGLARVVAECTAVIRDEGLRPDVIDRADLVSVYAKPAKKGTAAPEPALEGTA